MKGKKKKMFLNDEEDCSMASEKPAVDDFLVYTDPRHPTAFFDKLYDLYTRCELCDVNLCVNDKTISAHKIVLASNSSYFEGILLHLNNYKFYLRLLLLYNFIMCYMLSIFNKLQSTEKSFEDIHNIFYTDVYDFRHVPKLSG